MYYYNYVLTDVFVIKIFCITYGAIAIHSDYILFHIDDIHANLRK